MTLRPSQLLSRRITGRAGRRGLRRTTAQRAVCLEQRLVGPKLGISDSADRAAADFALRLAEASDVHWPLRWRSAEVSSHLLTLPAISLGPLGPPVSLSPCASLDLA